MTRLIHVFCKMLMMRGNYANPYTTKYAISARHNCTTAVTWLFTIRSGLLAITAAAGRADRENITGPDMPGDLARQYLAVEQVLTAACVTTTGQTPGRVYSTFGQQGKPGILQELVLSMHTLATVMAPPTCGVCSQGISYDP